MTIFKVRVRVWVWSVDEGRIRYKLTDSTFRCLNHYATHHKFNA